MRKIPLSNSSKMAVVSSRDYEFLSQFKWFLQKSDRNNNFYVRQTTEPHEWMHYLILPRRRSLLVDHKDLDTLNNRRKNLRYASLSQNKANGKLYSNNSSGYKGVHLHGDRFQARLRGEHERSLGHFDTAEEAARAYDKAVLEVYGEFARLNFPK